MDRRLTSKYPSTQMLAVALSTMFTSGQRIKACAFFVAVGFASGACQQPAASERGRQVELADAKWVDVGYACSPDSPATVAPHSASALLPDSTMPPRGNLNENWAWVARRLAGGWGGGPFFRRAGGYAAFYMKRPAARDSLLAAFLELTGAQVDFSMLKSATVLRGRWDFAELYDWSAYLLKELGWGYSIIGWDIQEAAIASS